MKRAFGINADCISGVSPVQMLEAIKATGFTHFFTDCYDMETVTALSQKAQELGLVFEFIHGPFKGINAMWHEGDGYLEIYNGMKEAIDSASANGVPTVIVHLSSGWDAPACSDLGWARFDALMQYAKEKNVTVALENLRVVGNLAYAIDRYEKMDNVRFCLDFGHQHGYTKTVEWADLFTDRLIATHIHDNHGRGKEKIGSPDEHLLPFDGSCDYARIMHKLDEYGYSGTLMLELFNSRAPEYEAMTPEEFLATSYERLKRISEM